MEKICYSLKQDVNSIGNLSNEIDRLTHVISDRDGELKGLKNKYNQYSN